MFNFSKNDSEEVNDSGVKEKDTVSEVVKNIFMRAGTKHGSKHIQLGYNNQDHHVFGQFTISAFDKTYYVGLVSDGCSGYPQFSRTEVGACLLSIFAYRRIQELICADIALEDIPKVLYSSCTELMLDIMGKLTPTTMVWEYPIPVKGRKNWSCQDRLKADYLAATLLGFISDGEKVVIFSAGDGIIMVDDDLEIIDQNNKPDYLATSVNQPGKSFNVKTYLAKDIKKVAVMTDGLEKLMGQDGFKEKIFSHMPGHPLGLQFFLNIQYNADPTLMQDDCTIVTLEFSRKVKEAENVHSEE